MRKTLAVLFFAVSSIITANILPAQAGGKLAFWSSTDELEKIINNYFKRDNRTIQINYSNFPTVFEFETRLDTVLASDRGAPDVFTLDAFIVRKYVESGQLMDLTDIYEANKNRFLRYPVEIGTYNGRVYALSWQANPGAMFYRRSLAKKYLGTDDPRVVRAYFSDIDKMMETAVLLKNRSGGSCVLIADMYDLLIPFFYARNSPWVVNKRVVIDPAMERFMDVCKILRENRMEGRVSQWSSRWFEGMKDELRDGNERRIEVFSYFFPDWGLQYLLKSNAPDTAGDWAMIQGPIPYMWGGTWIAVNKKTKNPAAAKELIRYITANDNFLERYARDPDSNGIAANLAVILRIQNSFKEPFLGGQNHYAAFAEIAEYVNGRLWQRTDQEIELIFRDAVIAYAEGEKTKAHALEYFKRQVQMQLGLQ